MRLPSRLLLAAAATVGGGLLAAAPASATSFFCQAAATVNDAGPLVQNTGATGCNAAAGAPESKASAAASATAGILRGGSHARTVGPNFVSASTYIEARDNVVVSGLGDAGATLTFRAHVDGLLDSNASGSTPFYKPTAASDFLARLFVSTTRGEGASDDLSGCVRNPGSGISVCNGVFDYGPSLGEVVSAFMTMSVFVKNGDVMDLGLSLRTSSLAAVVLDGDSAETGSHFGHTVYWDGLQFDDASRNVVLTSGSGFDYRNSAFPNSAAPEPATWALMILGFGGAGVALRRRRFATA